MIRVTNTETFIAKAKEVHGEKYDYSQSVYTRRRDKIEIYCNSCKVLFSQEAGSHLRGCGHKLCGTTKPSDTLESFINKSKAKHKNRYTYEHTNYVNSRTPVIVTCPIHGNFSIVPSYHVRGTNCPRCSGCYSPSNEEYISSCKNVHNNYYGYNETQYTTANAYVVITCPTHGNFTQRASAHLQGQGCPSCKKSGFNPNKPAILYYLSINNGQAYKIGITNRTIEERFRNSDLDKIEVLKEIYYLKGIYAKDHEKEILIKYKDYKYIGPDLLNDGNTELFNVDLLTLENPLIL